ncbi:hypothetical protein RCH09_001413, partial [Actimicrobium sp. GrIS 1.19]|uniref:hypothetical protein n=1 Tax=Actimicrobium sp. GrIS 1.19 TaxID=3071708 RepID=UPI002E023E20|nr:hypothetical protein [Actimicrobium sp. GrIS 1.19]
PACYALLRSLFLLDGGSLLPNDRLHKIIYTLDQLRVAVTNAGYGIDAATPALSTPVKGGCCGC